MIGRISITLRLTALFASVSTAVLLGLGYLIGGTVEQHFVEQDLEVLTGKLDLTRHALARVTVEADLVAVAQQLDDALVGHAGLAVAVQAPDGQLLFATSGAEFPEALLHRRVEVKASSPMVWRTARDIPMRGISAQVSTGMAGARLAVVGVATDISHHERYMAEFRLTLWSFVAAAALLTGVLGWLAVRRGLMPLQAMQRKAGSITAQQLHARLEVASVPVELADLAKTLNDMLARLEASFRRLADFSSDLAHEFRTPISNLMTQTQVTLSQPRTPEAYREILVSNIEEYERLSRMIADMLFIAKAEEGQIVLRRERLELRDLIDKLEDFHRVAADEKGVAIVSEGTGVVAGDSLMLRRAISNLLANAIRHAPAGERVSISIQRRPARKVTVEIANSGETIAAQHLPRLFDRFYRADPARSGDGSHSGLGLAIVKSIVEAHGGNVFVTSASGITRFGVVLDDDK